MTAITIVMDPQLSSNELNSGMVASVCVRNN